MFWPALATAVSSWWLLTGLALLLAHQSGQRARTGFILVSVLALAALLLVPFNASLNTPMAAAIGFILGLIIWCWLEISYLLGYVNGPNHQPCPPQFTIWDRFKGAVSTTIYHEACVVGAVACLALISVTEPNPTAFYTVTVLWLMRWSAKLNLFFGVRAFNERWLPDHLNYLVSYLRTERLSAFLPISTAIGFFVTYLIFKSAANVPDLTQQLSLYLVGSLMLLASIEHLFLMFPVNEAALWRWARANEPQLRAVRVEKDEI